MATYDNYNTLYDYIKNLNIPDGNHTLIINNVSIDIELYNFTSNITYITNPTLGDNVSDTKMLILKYQNNLTINSGVIVTPQVRKKGMLIYVDGDLTNNGIITMTARGAIATGQNVYLFKKKDGSYEYIPAIGGNPGGGGSSYNYNSTAGSGSISSPSRGGSGTNRQLGGGGGGRADLYKSSTSGSLFAYGGSGSAGTSYSGGSGGGGIYLNRTGGTSPSNTFKAGNATDNGGAGGSSYLYNTSGTATISSGVGNPAGTCSTLYGGTEVQSSSGTGGLLIIYSNSIYNNGTISSNGSDAGNAGIYGGGSGGGSINIFYINTYKLGNITVSGGFGRPGVINEGGGGNGTYNIFNLVTEESFNNILPVVVKNSLNNITNIGQAIPCRYTATTSGQVGYFSELGTTTAISIPIGYNTPATPNGLFYWIFVGYDTYGRMKFIADRNIQISISWDALNTTGIAGESGLPIFKTDTTNGYTIMLMTGGTSNTDTNNEWDQIIVNSNLNNTISAGDNNVWHWSEIASDMSTTISGSSTQKVIRGGSSVNYFNAMASNSASTASGFRPILLVENLATPSKFTGNLLSSSIHNQDAILTGSITNNNNIQYKILVNDVQIYPESGYTEFATSPVSINYSIPNSLLTNMNNKITITMNNELNKISTNDFYVTLYNNVPNGILVLSNTTTHSDNIELTGNISDSDLDKISYRILINDIEMLPWVTFNNDPYVDYTILNKDLNIGDNIIKVEYKDNYKSIGLGNWINIITKTNNTSIVNCQCINGSIIGTITDPDSDMVQYKILINNKQVYPASDFTEFTSVCNIDYQINRNDILLNQNNIVTIVAQDIFGSNISQDISFIGEYVGLMFMDEDKQFYTTDIGELLRYLDFGTITLGQITEPVKILVQNKYGFKIKDINLNIQNSLPNVNIEFSKEENPFIATENLILEKEYAINDIDYFYIRLNTSISSNSVNGEFKILAKATPI